MPHRPAWFRNDEVVVSNAPTCGINKDGAEQYKVDPLTGERSTTELDDKLAEDATLVQQGKLTSPYLSVCKLEDVYKLRVASPNYYDHSTTQAFNAFVETLSDFTSASLADLEKAGLVTIFHGHGSPSLDQRVGDVPYIKVSDLRAGSVNINPTNLAPRALAEKFWRGPTSGLKAYDLISPERASKNIGDFCVLMPGQEDVILTKEVIVVRATEAAPFDQFYLLWALTLREVRSQWNRVVLMQTNREDVGERALEVRIPVPKNRKVADRASDVFRSYYRDLEAARRKFSAGLDASPYKHSVFLG